MSAKQYDGLNGWKLMHPKPRRAYAEGAAAQQKGLSPTDNPHPESYPEHAAWVAGWNDADNGRLNPNVAQ